MTDPDRRLDAMLRGGFAPPDDAAFAAAARAAVGAPTRRPLWPWLLAAAALLVTGYLAFTRVDPQRHDGEQLGAMWAAAYEHAVAEGFGSHPCCESDLDLGGICKQRFDARLGHQDRGSTRLLGRYCGLPTGDFVTLLASTGGAPVCVHVCPRQRDPKPRLPEGSKLQLARREIGELVLYALSSAAADEALANFFLPEH